MAQHVVVLHALDGGQGTGVNVHSLDGQHAGLSPLGGRADYRGLSSVRRVTDAEARTKDEVPHVAS